MEGFHLQGVLVPPTLPGKVAPGGGSKPPACREDNVLGGHAAEATSFVPARRQDYRKVFGAASACSIPVLDLPPPGDSGHGVLGCSALDYLDIFGGFDGRDFAVPYEELFFDASQESGSVGAAPGPPSAPHNPATPSATSCRAKGLVETGYLKQGTPASEWSGEDYIGSSSSSVNYDLSDGAKQTNTAYHSASWSSKDDPVNATMHKNQVHTILGSTFVVENAKTSKFNTQVATDVCFYSSGCEETTKGHHPKKAVPSTSFSSNMNHPQNDKKAEPRPSKLESSVSWSSVNEQKESFMLSSWSTVSRSNSVSAKLSNKQSVHEDFAEKKTKGEWQNNNVRSTVISMRSGNDLKVRYIASEDVPANEALFSCSSSDHAASSSSESFPSHLTTNINFDAVDVRVAEANHLKKSMSQSTSCTSSQSSDYDNKAEVKQFNYMSKFLENSPVRRSHRSHISSGHSTSSWDQSYPDPAFLEVSNIILRTQPSQGPPPSRPPPSRPAPCSDFDACRPSADCHNCGIATGPTVKSHSFKQPVRDISPPLFDAGVDEGSAALASVTAIKEAMELAQARLKSAKLSMERKDNLQIGIKSGANNGQSIERDEDKANGELIFQQAQESSDGKSNVFDMEKMMREFRVSRQAADFKDKERNCRSLQQSLQELQLEEVSENALEHEETENKMSLTEKYMEVQEGVNNLKVWGWSFDQDEDEKELEVTHALGVSAEGIHLMISKKNQEDNNVKCIMTDGSACFHDGNEMKPDETGSLFDQYKRKNSNITQQTFEQAENENVLKAAHEVHDHKGNSAKLNEVKESDGCSGNEKKLKEVQKLPLSSEKEHAQPSIPPVSGIPDDADYSIMADGGNYQKKINENIKEIKVVLDRRQAILLGKQCHTCKGTEIEEEKDRRRRNLEEVEEMERALEEEIERDRMFQDEKDEKMKYEGDQKEKRYEVEERGRRKTVEEREKKELDEKQERVNLEKEEMKRRKLENKERKKMKLEEEERESKKLEEKEGGRRKLKEERDWRLEEAERERRKSEEKEGERRRIEEDDGDTKLEGEKDREMRVEEEERKRNVEEKERSRRRIEQKEREDGQMEQEREIEKRMMEAEKELKRVEPEGEKDKECEREKDRQAVEGEAHERVFVEAQERAERVALETVTAESQQRVQAEAQEERARTPAENLEKSLAEKASRVVRSQAEHAVVEKEMAETWEYAVETTHDARECAANFVPTSTDGLKRSGDLSDMWDPHLQFQTLDASGSSHQLFSEAFHASGEKFGGSEDESFIRCKARRERLQRTVERMGKALTEKNMRDTIAQREQAERHRLAETLDADVRRWSNGKEGNLRALLSTLQYILGPESGWQPIPLTEVITAPAVKKAYRKAMLCVHPDKLQQRSASIQQKYICEKVFDLLKEAWNRFNSEER